MRTESSPPPLASERDFEKVFIRDNLFESGNFLGCGVADDEKKREQEEFVGFLTAETGDDLIVSFAICEPDDPADIESLTILRPPPKYEFFLDERERGATVSFRISEGNERVMLREVVLRS